MPDEEERTPLRAQQAQDDHLDDDAFYLFLQKQKIEHPITWTPNAFLNPLCHDGGFSINGGFNKEKVQQDWVTYNCQHLGLPIPHLRKL